MSKTYFVAAVQPRSALLGADQKYTSPKNQPENRYTPSTQSILVLKMVRLIAPRFDAVFLDPTVLYLVRNRVLLYLEILHTMQ
jgi:hypothetical protein